jgi:hypothetical protein
MRSNFRFPVLDRNLQIYRRQILALNEGHYIKFHIGAGK